MKIFLFIITLLFIPSSDSLSSSTSKDYNTVITYLEDVEGSITFETIEDEDFYSISSDIFSLGMSQSTVWVKIILDKESINNIAVIEVQRAFLDHVTLYYKSPGNITHQETLGLKHPYSKNTLNHFVPAFEIPLEKLQSDVVYLKIQSNWSLLIPLNITSKAEFNKNRITNYLISGIFIGGILLIAIYNLFLYFSTRDFSYLLYVIAILFSLLAQGYISGILIQYLSPDAPIFNYRFPVFLLCLTPIFSILFTLFFLEVKKTSKFFFIVLCACIVFSLVIITLELLQLDFIARTLVTIQILVVTFSILITGIYCLYKGVKMAIFFTLAWTFYLAGIFTFALKTLGFIPHNLFTEHFMHLGTFMEAILLSFALGYKYYTIRIEKERLERQTRQELEELVNLQTLKLASSLEEKEVLLKEIHHRVKNNLQLVISILDLQLASINDSTSIGIISQSKSRVYSMSLIHQKLYESDSLANVNVKNYITDLFTYIRDSYGESNDYDYIINIEEKDISLSKAVPLGLIVNELLTNSMKYGVKGRDGTIQIDLSFTPETLELFVADSGEGFDEKALTGQVKKSLGLFLVNSLTKQLRGTLKRHKTGHQFITSLSIPLKLK